MIKDEKKDTFKTNVPSEKNIITILAHVKDKRQRYTLMKNIYMWNFYDCSSRELEMLDSMFRNESRLFYEN